MRRPFASLFLLSLSLSLSLSLFFFLHRIREIPSALCNMRFYLNVAALDKTTSTPFTYTPQPKLAAFPSINAQNSQEHCKR